jgi:ketosteroid isomerase-like protein
MRHLRPLVPILFCALFAGCQAMGGGGSAGPAAAESASAGSAKAGPGGSGEGADAKSAVTKLLEQYRKALVEKDIATIDRIWSDDLTFINYRGQFLTKAQRMENVRTGATLFKSIQISDQLVRAFGDAVVTTGVSTIEGQYSGEEGSGAYRVTTVWSRHTGQWQMVAIQMTKIMK